MKCRGPAPLLSKRHLRLLLRTSAQGNLSAAQLKIDLSLPVSVTTVQRILADVDWFVYTKMENTLPHTVADMSARKFWAKDMLLHEDAGSVLDSIIFLDEKKWYLDGPDGIQHYWRDVRQFVRQKKRRQAGGGSTMIWAAFSACGKSPLVVLTGRQNSDDYVYTVSEYLRPFAHLTYGEDFIFQQDNASIHVSDRSREFFSKEGIQVLDWPSKSSGLNPIENLWSIVSRQVYANGTQFECVSELKAALIAAWNAISNATLVSLVRSMPRRCIEVIEKKGSKTHY
uniref:Tc1-like transposase DDE domain-containing protein n=1 Tax=Peronospora matthiolae TaxID=2874970 RepID=A0AAV1TT56_9STRA